MNETATTTDTDSIGHFLDYREYLRSQLTHLQSQGQSLRSLSIPKPEGGKYSAQFVSQVLAGKRPLPEAAIGAFAKAFAVPDEAKKAFAHLVAYSEADSIEARRDALFKLARRDDFRQHSGLSNPARLGFILDATVSDVYLLSARPDFAATPAWITANIGRAIKKSEAKTAVATLEDLGLIKGGQRTNVRPPIPRAGESALFEQFHAEQCSKAALALDTCAPSMRSYKMFGVTRYTPEDWQAMQGELTEKIEATIQEVASKYATKSEAATIVGQINLQIFPVSAADAS